MKQPLLYKQQTNSYLSTSNSNSDAYEEKINKINRLNSVPAAVLKNHLYIYLAADDLFQLAATCLTFYGRHPLLRTSIFLCCCRFSQKSLIHSRPDFTKGTLPAPVEEIKEPTEFTRLKCEFTRLKWNAEQMVEKGFYCRELAGEYRQQGNQSKALFWERKAMEGNYSAPDYLARVFLEGTEGAVRDPERGKLSYWMEYGFKFGVYAPEILADRFYYGNEGFEKNYAKAASYYELYLKQHPGALQVQLNLANCYEQGGEVRKALKIYKQIVSTNDSSSFKREAKIAISRLTGDSNQTRCLCM